MPVFRYYKIAFLLILMLVLTSTIIHLTNKQTTTASHSWTIQCYHNHSNSLPSMLQSHPQPDSIFFHETSCTSARNGKIVITARQACAVESAAVLHPNSEIYLLYTAPGVIRNGATESDPFMQALQSYSNIKIRHIDFGKYVRDSPVEELWKSRQLEKSEHAALDATDILRFVTLWRYGGTTLDLDVIVIKSLEDLAPSFAGQLSQTSLSNAVLKFERSETGHRLVRTCLEDQRDNFRTLFWHHNGSDIVTRLAKEVCGFEDFDELLGDSCLGIFRVYPSDMFYPVPADDWSTLFEEDQVQKVEEITRSSYVVHFWGSRSGKRKIPVGTKVPYTLFAEEYCPKVFSKCTDFF